MNTNRTCDNCDLCCIWLFNVAYGHTCGNGKPCDFLRNKRCSIYEKRPNSCVNYFCAWRQGLFPDWMKPSECGIIISVSNLNEHEQFLEIVETDVSIYEKVFKEVESFANANNCGIRFYNKKENKTYYFGPENFLRHFNAE